MCIRDSASTADSRAPINNFLRHRFFGLAWAEFIAAHLTNMLALSAASRTAGYSSPVTQAKAPAHDQARLSLFDATMLVMGGIIGVGIFFKPHEVAGLVPVTGPYFAIWGLGALAAIVGAMTFAELAGSFPKAGGWYVFLREGFGPFASFLFAWIVLLVISTGASAGVAGFCATKIYSLVAPDAEPSFLIERCIAAALILSVTALGMTGVKTSAIFQNLCMLAKLLAIATFVFAGLVLFELPPAQAPAASAANDIPWSGMMRGTLPVLFTYGGWQLVTYIAPSVKDPERNLPRAIILGMLGVGAVYLALNAAYVRVLGIEGVATLPDVPGELARRTLGSGGVLFLSLAMAISAIGFLTATLIATPGIYVAMAKEGLFVQAVGKRHPRTGAPVLALLLQASICILYLAVHHDVVKDLGDSVVFGEWIFHCLTGLTLLRLRKRRPDLPRPFKSPLYPLCPALYTLLAGCIVYGNLVTNAPSVTYLGLGVLAAGALVYLPWNRFAKSTL